MEDVLWQAEMTEPDIEDVFPEAEDIVEEMEERVEEEEEKIDQLIDEKEDEEKEEPKPVPREPPNGKGPKDPKFDQKVEEREPEDRDRKHHPMMFPVVPVVIIGFMLMIACGTACFIAYRCGKRRASKRTGPYGFQQEEV